MELGMCSLEKLPKMILQLPHPHPHVELLFELLLHNEIKLLSDVEHQDKWLEILYMRTVAHPKFVFL